MISDPSDYDAAATVLLLYHTFGPNERRGVRQDSLIYQTLGDYGIDLYKVIFDKNNKRDRNQTFF